MHPERWQRIETLYHQVLARPAGERSTFLDQECGGDQALRLEVESLVAQDAGGEQFLEEPALAVGARLVADEVAGLTGRQLGPYQILELLGAGGMGEVYRARDLRLQRDVALKMLHGAPAEDSKRRRRFLDEARAAGSLNHPNILAVYDIATDNDLPYIVVELVDGESLRAELKRGPFRLPRLLDIATQIADGLTAAHHAQVVHRDLKPENVMITRGGRVKIVDFGLAKPLGLPRDDIETWTITAPNAVVGTAAYMSPEQARGEAVDFRSDLFSFGAVLYEMATGQRAFDRRSSIDTLAAVLHDEPRPLSELNDQLPRELQRIVARCLAKAPEERYAATADLLHDVRWLRDHPAPSPPPTLADPRPRRHLAILATLGLAVAMSAVFLGWAVNGRGAAEPVSREFPTWRRLTFEEGYVHAARFGPGGETILYSASWDGEPFQVLSTTTLRPESRTLDLPPGGLLALSRSGQLALSLSCVYQQSNGGCVGTLARAPLLGGAPRPLAENVQSADWGPNDTLAAVVDGRLEYPLGTRFADQATIVRVSPDGQRLAWAELEPDTATSQPGSPEADNSRKFAVVVWNGQSTRVLSRGWTFISGLAWAVDGGAVLVSGVGPDSTDDTVLRIGMDGTARAVLRSSSRVRVLDAAAPDRLLIDHSSSSRRAWIHDLSATGARRDVTWLGSSVVDALSNDGRTMLLTVRAGPTLEGGRAESLYPIYARPTTGGPATFLGTGYGRALSGDGRWALTVTRSTPGGRDSSLILYPLGPGSARTLDRGEVVLRGRATNASFAGSDRIVFDAAHGDGMRTYVQSIAGGPPTRVEHEPGQVVSPVAPDGERFLSRRRDGSLWIATLAPRPATRLPFSLQPNQSIRQWSDDGRHVFILTLHGDRAVLARLNVKTGRTLSHAEVRRDRMATQTGWSLHISRDGRTIAYSDSRILSNLYLIEGAR